MSEPTRAPVAGETPATDLTQHGVIQPDRAPKLKDGEAPAAPEVVFSAESTLEDYEKAGFEPFAIGSDAFIVTFEAFTGPLDLILFLVKKHRLDIYNLDIAKLVDAYTGWLDRAKDLNIDVAGGYLEMAASLAHIKSRILLPPTETDDDGEPEEVVDPRLELVRQLLLVQKYQHAAQQILRLGWLGRDTFTRPPQVAALDRGDGEKLLPFDVIDLVKLYVAQTLARKEPVIPQAQFVEQLSVSERISELLDDWGESLAIAFDALFKPDFTKDQRILTFLAVLEMGKLRMVRIRYADDGALWLDRKPLEPGESAAPDLTESDDYR
jgi:segregation and condensation protein A